MADFNSNGNQVPPDHTALGVSDRRGHFNQPMIPTSHDLQQPAHLQFTPLYSADQRTWLPSVSHPNVVEADNNPLVPFTDFSATMPNEYTVYPAPGQVNSMESGTALAPSGEMVDPFPAVPSEIANSSADRVYLCEWKLNDWSRCNCSFSQNEELQQHFNREHYPPQRRPCKWADCQKDFKRPRDLKNHVFKVHLTPKPSPASFACLLDGCNNTYGRGDNLERHVRQKHR